MKKIFIAVGVLAVAIAGFWLLSPLFINTVVFEDLPIAMHETQDPERATVQIQDISTGTFSGFDVIHTGSGTARVIVIDGKSFIRFEEDFHVNNGPDLYVGLGKDGRYIENSEISQLKGNIGSQNYELPETIDPASIEEIWVWCKAFSVPFTRAVLQSSAE